MEEKLAEETRPDDVEDGMEIDGEVAKSDPTHWKLLDPKTMKVNEMREQLNARGINSKGLKSQLLARLIKCLENGDEKEKGDQEGEIAEKEIAEEEASEDNKDEKAL